MKTIIYFVRHGQTDWNKQLLIQGRLDNPLNECGRKQVAKTGELLKAKGINFDVVLSSPLSRAKESAEIIKSILNINQETIIYPNAIEREFGEAEGALITDAIYDRILKDDIEGMEKSYELVKRGNDAIFDIASKFKGKVVLVAAHSHFIKGVFISLSDEFYFRSTLNNASFSTVTVEDGKVISFEFNIHE